MSKNETSKYFITSLNWFQKDLNDITPLKKYSKFALSIDKIFKNQSLGHLKDKLKNQKKYKNKDFESPYEKILNNLNKL